MTPQISLLPLPFEIETKKVLKKAAEAHSALAELKGVCRIIPNQVILIDTLPIREAKESSAIENIITTHDEIYRAEMFSELTSPEIKEVRNYHNALKSGYMKVRLNGFLSTNIILEVQSLLEQNDAGFRKVPGTTLTNKQTGEVIYIPPQEFDTLVTLMSNLEKFIHDNEDGIDPLVKMAIIHYQFEKIHPFYDGNGRKGRIINILYLVLRDLLGFPVLYLSRYLIKHRMEYYRLLKEERNVNTTEEWILFMLEGVKQTSLETIILIRGIFDLMDKYKHDIRNTLPKIYSKDLLENLFKHPYTKIEFLQNDLECSRNTAINYLKKLTEHGFLTRHKVGKGTYYVNEPLFNLLSKSE